MQLVLLIFIFSLAGLFASAHEDSRPPLDEAYEAKWVHEFIKKAEQSKNIGDLVRHLGSVQSRDAFQLSQIIDPHHPLPQMTYRDHSIFFDKNVELKIVSLSSYQFRINGHSFKYDPKQSLLANAQKINLAMRRRSSVKMLWPLGLGESLSAANKKAEDSGDDDDDDDDDDSKNELFFDKYEPYTRDPLKVGDDSVIGWVFISPALLADFIATKGESFFATDCPQQVSEINKILEDNKLGIRSLYCGSEYRGTDRKITFWVPKGKGQKPDKKVFLLDFRAGTLHEEDSNRMMLFGYDHLEEIRDIKYNQEGHAYRVDYHPNSPEFEKAKSEIERFRKVLFYMGVNRSCDKCPKALKQQVATKLPPPSLMTPVSNKGPSADASKSPKGRR